MLELHVTYKRHEILIKKHVSAWCFMKNINVYIANSVFPERADQIYWGWCVCALAAPSTFQGKISQLPPSMDNMHRSQERALPKRLLSHSWPLYGFINWVALLSYLDDFDFAVFELRLIHPFCWWWHHETIAIWTGNGWAPRWVLLASMGQKNYPIGWEIRNLEHIYGFSEEWTLKEELLGR